ncbi:agamous-like MADS-box protein AGL66 [Macadamia integrifolia]|uniref:agamous-like MADS-box protein AGL66 n=1 Tax=Macadamia integrifolia TaxID=60698 RepID=UPI001C4F9170|nr:agamous-like MADS-box protein AGL66 [Macadamia integrifolia]XP_042509388.1 agamous-like MADS-box protein AGL66 [Macadamia integrifolia]XP_042509389.1 agamous-like MADS-box protein AGL66 [Macadamia integrifolia]
MGRAKPQIKKIENTTKRQIPFPKRRNGILKKAYELSILCDVDVAFIAFSTSGKATIFAGNKRVEEVLLRYLSLPEHETGGHHVHLQKTLEHMMDHENDLAPRVKDFEREIHKVKVLLEIAKTKLSMYEVDRDRINSLHEVDYHEQILQAALNRVRARQFVLQGQYTSPGVQPSGQVYVQAHDVNEKVVMAPENRNHVLNWSFPPTDPQLQIFNPPLRDQTPQASSTFCAPPSALFYGNYGQFANQVNPSIGSEGGGGASHQEAGQGHITMPGWVEYHATGKGNFQA